MVATDKGPLAIFVAGYQNLTQQEFATHYQGKIDSSVRKGHAYLLPDEPGTSAMACDHLMSKNVSGCRISIYKTHLQPQSHLPTSSNIARISTTGSETEHYAQMVRKSDTEIIWLRPGDELSDHGCRTPVDILDMQFVGAKEAMRAARAKSMKAGMDYYDTIV